MPGAPNISDLYCCLGQQQSAKLQMTDQIQTGVEIILQIPEEASMWWQGHIHPHKMFSLAF